MIDKKLQNKFVIQRTDGKPIDPEAFYFVLRLDNDPEAVRAVMDFARRKGNEALYNGVRDRFIKGKVTHDGEHSPKVV